MSAEHKHDCPACFVPPSEEVVDAMTVEDLRTLHTKTYARRRFIELAIAHNLAELTGLACVLLVRAGADLGPDIAVQGAADQPDEQRELQRLRFIDLANASAHYGSAHAMVDRLERRLLARLEAAAIAGSRTPEPPDARGQSRAHWIDAHDELRLAGTVLASRLHVDARTGLPTKARVVDRAYVDAVRPATVERLVEVAGGDDRETVVLVPMDPATVRTFAAWSLAIRAAFQSDECVQCEMLAHRPTVQSCAHNADAFAPARPTTSNPGATTDGTNPL